MTTMSILLVSSNSSPREDKNMLTTNIYIAGAQSKSGTFASSFIPTTTTTVTRATDDLEEIATSFPSMFEVLGASVTTSRIGFSINVAETAAMSRLHVEASPGTLDWNAELLFIS